MMMKMGFPHLPRQSLEFMGADFFLSTTRPDDDDKKFSEQKIARKIL